MHFTGCYCIHCVFVHLCSMTDVDVCSCFTLGMGKTAFAGIKTVIVVSDRQAASQSNNNKRQEANIDNRNLPVMVSANAPHPDAADWLRVEQAAIIWVDQSQHTVLKHQQHPFTL